MPVVLKLWGGPHWCGIVPLQSDRCKHRNTAVALVRKADGSVDFYCLHTATEQCEWKNWWQVFSSLHLRHIHVTELCIFFVFHSVVAVIHCSLQRTIDEKADNTQYSTHYTKGRLGPSVTHSSPDKKKNLTVTLQNLLTHNRCILC